MSIYDEEPSRVIPYGYCHCGCGRKTTIAGTTRNDMGCIKGEPCKFCVGHRLLSRKGSNSSSWKGGIVKHSNGYILIFLPNHPQASSQGYVPEHVNVRKNMTTIGGREWLLNVRADHNKSDFQGYDLTMEYFKEDSGFSRFTKADILASIKPIETRWNGYRFRSRLEARWALFMHELGIKFEYEPEGFELICGPYLPDFWLPIPEGTNFSGYPGAGHWLEVKGPEPTQHELSALLHLSIATKHSGILVWGTPWNFKQYFTHRNGNHGWAVWHEAWPCSDEDHNLNWNLQLMFHNYHTSDSAIPAVLKAKSARFEFGEKP